MKHFIFSIAFLFLTSAAICEDGKPAFEKDVIYGKTSGVELKMDLARPTTGNGPFPCVVCIHGGGWRAGNKSGYDGLIQALAKEGYVAATVEYRFCPQFKFPAQVEDVKCAVRYLRAHAVELKINPEKFGAYGESAGGHLSLMLGLMNKEDGLEGDGGCPEQSSKVQVVVNYFGPGDFTVPGDYSIIGRNLVKDFLGTEDAASELAKKASPSTYIDKSDAPVLTFHGSIDPLVPVEMSKRLHEILKKAGVEEKLEVLDGKSHGWGGPDKDRTIKQSLEFFNKHLKN